MDIRSDNPVGRVPDTRVMRSKRLTITERGWGFGRRQGAWDASGIERLLGLLDTWHETFWSLPAAGPAAASGAASDTVIHAGAHDGFATSAAAIADFLQRAVARGTSVAGPIPAPVRELLPPALASLIHPEPVAGGVGTLEWDIHAVRQRRAALVPLMPKAAPMSAVLVSKRPELVPHMVSRLAAQHYDNLEIVVGIHGGPVPRGLAKRAGSRPLIAKELPGDLIYGDALREAFSWASGELVHKADDDDFISDDHLLDLALAHRYSGATVVGKTTTVVYIEAIDTTVRRVFGARETFTHRVAGSTMTLAKSDLESVGNWSPVPRGVDTALLESVAKAGGSVYQPHDIGYLYRRGADPNAHTWTTGAAHFLRNVREQWVGLLEHEEFGTTIEPDAERE